MGRCAKCMKELDDTSIFWENSITKETYCSACYIKFGKYIEMNDMSKFRMIIYEVLAM